MAKKRKKKILYHRLILVIALAVFCVFGTFKILGFGFNQFVSLFNELKVEEKVNVEKKQSSDNVQETMQKYTVVIDAGHGGYDDGSIALDGTKEKDITLDMALKVGAMLEKEKDINVVYTRVDDDVYWTNDNVQDLQARINVAYDANADFFVSLHMNDNDDTSISGYEVYMSQVSNTHVMLASNINEKLKELNYTNARGLYDESLTPLMVISWNEKPSTLVEMGFIRNEDDFNYITSKKGSKALAKAIAEGIIESCHELQK